MMEELKSHIDVKEVTWNLASTKNYHHPWDWNEIGRRGHHQWLEEPGWVPGEALLSVASEGSCDREGQGFPEERQLLPKMLPKGELEREFSGENLLKTSVTFSAVTRGIKQTWDQIFFLSFTNSDLENSLASLSLIPSTVNSLNLIGLYNELNKTALC